MRGRARKKTGAARGAVRKNAAARPQTARQMATPAGAPSFPPRPPSGGPRGASQSPLRASPLALGRRPPPPSLPPSLPPSGGAARAACGAAGRRVFSAFVRASHECKCGAARYQSERARAGARARRGRPRACAARPLVVRGGRVRRSPGPPACVCRPNAFILMCREPPRPRRPGLPGAGAGRRQPPLLLRVPPRARCARARPLTAC